VYDWVRPFLKADGKTPDPEKCGELRWFTIENQSVKWVDKDWRDIDKQTGEEIKPKSFTFIPAHVSDNQYLGGDYVGSLRTQSKTEQDRLLRGLWVTEAGKAMFRHHDIQIVEPKALPSGLRWVRYWDLADTHVPPNEQNPRKASGPDWTAGAKCAVWYPPKNSMHYDEDGQPILIVGDVEYVQQEGAKKHRTIQRCAKRDGKHTLIGIETEGGSSGKETARNYNQNVLRDYQVKPDRPTGDKEERAKPWRALAENGRVWFVNGPWNAQVLWWVERFPEHKKDVIDAISGALPLADKRAVRTSSTNRKPRAIGSFSNPFG
jgi:phage terminase large subunit-like protein